MMMVFFFFLFNLFSLRVIEICGPAIVQLNCPGCTCLLTPVRLFYTPAEKMVVLFCQCRRSLKASFLNCLF